jgi:predicted outer membrane protein
VQHGKITTTFASCVAIENQEEIAIAKFAKEKSKNKDVQKFADMLVKDHTEFLGKLRKLAPEATKEGFLTEESTDGKTRTAAKPPLDGQRDGTVDQLALQRELAEQCVEDSKAALSEKSAEEFDECFVGQQIAKHAAMKTKLTVFQRHASDELGELLAAGEKKTFEHLEHVEKLIKQLKKADSKSSK